MTPAASWMASRAGCASTRSSGDKCHSAKHVDTVAVLVFACPSRSDLSQWTHRAGHSVWRSRGREARGRVQALRAVAAATAEVTCFFVLAFMISLPAAEGLLLSTGYGHCLLLELLSALPSCCNSKRLQAAMARVLARALPRMVVAAAPVRCDAAAALRTSALAAAPARFAAAAVPPMRVVAACRPCAVTGVLPNLVCPILPKHLRTWPACLSPRCRSKALLRAIAAS